MSEPSLTRISQAIVDRLEPLRSANLVVRRLPTTPREVGQITGNGVLTLALDSISTQDGIGRGAAVGSLGFDSVVQPVVQNWVIEGRVRNLRGDAGLDLLADWLIERLFAWQVPLTAGPIRFTSFSLEERTEAFWLFLFRFAVPTVLVAEVGAEATDTATEDSRGAVLAQTIFDVVEVRDELGVFVDTNPE